MSNYCRMNKSVALDEYLYCCLWINDDSTMTYIEMIIFMTMTRPWLDNNIYGHLLDDG